MRQVAELGAAAGAQQMGVVPPAKGTVPGRPPELGADVAAVAAAVAGEPVPEGVVVLPELGRKQRGGHAAHDCVLGLWRRQAAPPAFWSCTHSSTSPGS